MIASVTPTVTVTDRRPALNEGRQLWFDLIAVALVLGLVVAVGWAFVLPWMAQPSFGGALLERYSPLRDGASYLVEKTDAKGKPLSWTGQNIALLKSGRAMGGEVREAGRNSISAFYSDSQDPDPSSDTLVSYLKSTQIYELRTRDLGLDGVITDTVYVFLREPRGDFLASLYNPKAGGDTAFDPPAQTIVADPSPGKTWSSEGKFGASTYKWTGEVLDAGEYKTKLGQFSDCLRIETQLSTTTDGKTDDSLWYDWYCAGVGVVDTKIFNSEKFLTSRSTLISADGFPADLDSLPTPAANAPQTKEAPPAEKLSDWRLDRVARLGRSTSGLESTIPAVWVPTDPPAVLASGYDGDLVAFDANNPTGSILWRFHAGGPIFSPPGYDPVSSRIYFGSSDKRVYALDGNGIFLWSFPTGDSIASTPLAVGDVVVLGSEDRNIYGVDANTGQERWRVQTGAAVVSSAASYSGTVVIGSDDGVAYGLDAATGQEKWRLTTSDGIEAPVIEQGGTIFVTSRDSKIYALEPTTGNRIWTANVSTIPPVSPLRTAPLITEERVIVSDENGYLTAFDRKDGRYLWKSPKDTYIGTPVMVGDTIVVAGKGDKIYRIGPDGKEQGEWAVGVEASNGIVPYFSNGPTLGGGAAWLSDSTAIVRRLGPELTNAGPLPLSLTWVGQFSLAPFAGSPLSTTTLEYKDKAVTLDDVGNVYLIDPASGQGNLLGQTGDGKSVPHIDSVISGDTLLSPIGDTIYAVNLLDGKTLWKMKGDGVGFAPPVVSEGVVVWLTQPTDNNFQVGKGTLRAIDVKTGTLRWQAAVEKFNLSGGAAIRDGFVYISTPPSAFELSTGKVRWQMEGAPGLPSGGVSLSGNGDTLYVGMHKGDKSGGIVVALSTSDGEISWQSDLKENALSPKEPIWPSDGLLIVPLLSGDVMALDETTGAESWRYKPQAPRMGNITVAEGRVWFALENGQVIGLSAKSGKPVAQFSDLDLSLGGIGFAQRPALIGGKLIVTLGIALLGLTPPAP